MAIGDQPTSRGNNILPIFWETTCKLNTHQLRSYRPRWGYQAVKDNQLSSSWLLAPKSSRIQLPLSNKRKDFLAKSKFIANDGNAHKQWKCAQTQQRFTKRCITGKSAKNKKGHVVFKSWFFCEQRQVRHQPFICKNMMVVALLGEHARLRGQQSIQIE